MRIRMRHRLSVVAALAGCCCVLVSCGTQRAGDAATAAPTAGPCLTDTTSDDQGELPDTTSDDQGELPDETTDDSDDFTDETTDDAGGVPTSGPNCWYPMLREFRAYLTADAPNADAALAAHVTGVRVRVPAGGARTESVVRVDFGAGEEGLADRTAAAFARWRGSVYGDRGHVEVLGPAKTTAGLDW